MLCKVEIEIGIIQTKDGILRGDASTKWRSAYGANIAMGVAGGLLQVSC